MNLRVPPAVERLSDRLHPELTCFDRIRERHTLVVKRIENDTWETGHGGVRERLRRVLDSTAPFPVRIDGVDYFADPPDGPGPVVYLSVDSPGIDQLHRRFCQEFPVIDAVEGENYVPHVTVARGGSAGDAERFVERTEIEPVEWTADHALTWDRDHREAVDRFRLRG